MARFECALWVLHGEGGRFLVLPFSTRLQGSAFVMEIVKRVLWPSLRAEGAREWGQAGAGHETARQPPRKSFVAAELEHNHIGAHDSKGFEPGASDVGQNRGYSTQVADVEGHPFKGGSVQRSGKGERSAFRTRLPSNEHARGIAEDGDLQGPCRCLKHCDLEGVSRPSSPVA